MKKYFFLIFLIFFSFSLFSQSFEDALRYSRNYSFGTARSLGMSGAFGALGADMSCGSINPAGLAIFNSQNYNFSILYGTVYSESDYYGSVDKDSYKHYLNLPSFGLVFSDNSDQEKRWNIGVTYNKLMNFASTDLVSGFNSQSSLIDVFQDYASGSLINDLNPFYESLAFWTDLIDLSDNTIDTNTNYYMYDNGSYSSSISNSGSNQILNRETSGDLSELVLSISNSYLDRFYFGFGLGISVLDYKQYDSYFEGGFSDSLSSLNNFSFNSDLHTSGAGFNFKLGSIMRLTNNLKLGFSYHSKTYYDLEDVWETRLNSNFDNISYSDYSPLGYYDYKLRTPSKLIMSSSFVNKFIVLSCDIESMNYSSASLHDSYDSFDYENDSISNYLSKAINTKIGIEFNVKGFKVRGGFASYGNPYNDFSMIENYNYSFGLGFNSKFRYFDIAFVNRFTSQDIYLYNSNYTSPANISRNRQDFIFTLGWRIPN